MNACAMISACPARQTGDAAVVADNYLPGADPTPLVLAQEATAVEGHHPLLAGSDWGGEEIF